MARANGNQGAAGQRAFVLLYAVMTSTIVLAVGVSIISIALKQLAISTLGRESQYAFYAANTGAECALYWDFHGVLKEVVTSVDGAAYERLAVFSNPFLATGRQVTEDADMESVTCAQTELMANVSCNPSVPGGPDDSWCEDECDSVADPAACDQTTFTVFLGRDASGAEDREGPCARVTVEKVRGSSAGGVFTPSASGTNLQTIVDSRGYNYCDEDNPRRVERGLRFTY
jgi:hypothetical protein